MDLHMGTSLIEPGMDEGNLGISSSMKGQSCR